MSGLAAAEKRRLAREKRKARILGNEGRRLGLLTGAASSLQQSEEQGKQGEQRPQEERREVAVGGQGGNGDDGQPTGEATAGASSQRGDSTTEGIASAQRAAQQGTQQGVGKQAAEVVKEGSEHQHRSSEQEPTVETKQEEDAAQKQSTEGQRTQQRGAGQQAGKEPWTEGLRHRGVGRQGAGLEKDRQPAAAADTGAKAGAAAEQQRVKQPTPSSAKQRHNSGVQGLLMRSLPFVAIIATLLCTLSEFIGLPGVVGTAASVFYYLTAGALFAHALVHNDGKAALRAVQSTCVFLVVGSAVTSLFAEPT